MKKIVFLFFIGVMGLAKAQIDSAIMIPLVGVHVGGQLPFEDLSKRFGPDLNAGATFIVKTKKNWILGIESNYFFGRNVKEDVLSQLKNSDGFMIDNEGYPADIRVSERGVGIHLFVGRVFKVASANPNSGLMVNVGAGYLQHKIKLYDAAQKIAAIKGNLVHGYDRLTSGISIMQFVGYLFLSENRLLNFYAGVECYEAFTKSARKVNYDTGLPDTKSRVDILTGLRVGWILPLYKKKPNDFYYD